MCGIFAYYGSKNNAGDIILEGLKSLEYRGYDSWGVAVKQTGGKLYIEKHVGKIGNATLPKISSQIGIGHTRWATHGGVTRENSHPHTDCTKKVVIVHNGIIENFEQYREELTKKSHHFKSETDTEVIAHLIEEELKKEPDEKKAVTSVFKKLSGLNAIITLFPDKNLFIAVKSGSPMVAGMDLRTNELYLASDQSAILTHTQNIYFLEDEELLTADHTGFSLFDLQGKKKIMKYTTVTTDVTSLGMGKFPDFMSKEIHEQPKILLNIVNNEEKKILALAQIIREAFGTYFIGCGTASYAALAGTYLFANIAKRHANMAVASEFSLLKDFLKKESLVIALSQSGETIDVISAIKNAQEKHAKIVSITNGLGSTLYRMADYKLLLGAGPEKAVCSTKAFTAKIAILLLLAYSLDGGYKKGALKVNKAAAEVTKILKKSNEIKTLANKLKNKDHIYILGRGLSYPTAMESTLKIKEVSYIHAEGFAAGELKHGVIALIEKGTPVIVYNPPDETYEDTLSSAYEVKARGAYVIGISDKNNSVYDEFIQVEDCQEATIIPNVVVAQLLGYYLAKAKDLDPDKPRNLAKSVTVK